MRKHEPRITVIVDEEFRHKVRMKALKNNIDVSDVVRILLLKWLKEK